MADAPLVDSLPYRFGDHELARLVSYKAAVEAGFYTDWCTDVLGFDWKDLLGVGQPTDAHPFSAAALARLTAYKGAIRAGLYSDHFEGRERMAS